jgi:hypothetical protein
MVLDELEEKLNIFLTSVPDGGERSTSLCSRCAPRKDFTILVMRLGRFTAGLDIVTKIKHPAGNRTPVCDTFYSIINWSWIREIKFCNSDDSWERQFKRQASQPTRRRGTPANQPLERSHSCSVTCLAVTWWCYAVRFSDSQAVFTCCVDSDWRLWNFIATVLQRTCYDVEVAVGSTSIIHVPVVSNLVIGVRFYSVVIRLLASLFIR